MQKIGRLRAIGGIEKGQREQLPGDVRIVARPREPGQREDVLEKAALQGLPGTLPERIIWRWLDAKNLLYQTQAVELGGRLVVGGAVVDFLVWGLAGPVVALRVQGEYWHGPLKPGQQSRDDEQAGRLRTLGYLVVDLWEGEIYEAVREGRLGAYIEGKVGGM